MSSRLAWIAVTGIGIGAVCFGVAMAVGGKVVFDHLDDLDFGGWDNPRCAVALANRSDSRALDWSGGDRISFDVPANIHYQRGQGDKLVINGDAAILPLIEIDDNHVKLNCHFRRFGQRLDITLPGRDFESYTVNGSGDLMLAGIEQTRLKIRINGSGSATASGRAGELDYTVAGSGDGHFENLVATNVSISVAGSGDADVAPQGRLDVKIAGSGKVTLHSEPRQLETHIAGSGRIIHTDGSVTRKNGVTSSEDWMRDNAAPPPIPPEPPAPPAPPPPPAKLRWRY